MSNINNFYSRIDRLPDGHSVVRGSDKILLLVWIASLVASLVVAVTGLYNQMWLLVLPFAVAGFANMVLSKLYARVTVAVILCVAAWFIGDGGYPFFFFLALYIFLGLNGTAAIVDSLQRLVFFPVLSRIRYVNIREDSPLADRLVAFLFNIPEDADTRNLDANLDVNSHKLSVRDIIGNVMVSAVVATIIWIVVSVWPLNLIGSDSVISDWLLIVGITAYVPLFTLPFTVFRSMDVRIPSSFGVFRLFDGFVTVLRYFSVPLVLFLVASLVYSVSTGVWTDAVACILCSAAILCVSVAVVTLILFYQFEATSAYAMANKWKLFMPVPLLMGIRENDKSEHSFPGTPERDETIVLEDFRNQ